MTYANAVSSIADGYALVVGVHRVVKEKERQKHDKRQRKREAGYRVDCHGQMNLIGHCNFFGL